MLKFQERACFHHTEMHVVSSRTKIETRRNKRAQSFNVACAFELEKKNYEENNVAFVLADTFLVETFGG